MVEQGNIQVSTTVGCSGRESLFCIWSVAALGMGMHKKELEGLFQQLRAQRLWSTEEYVVEILGG